MSDKIFLSGVTPSSPKGLHIGNYFGAVKPQIEFQNEGKCIYFVANMHALNTVFNKKEVETNTMNIFIEYLALGIDVSKTIFFIQSDVPAIPYIQTILNNVVTVGELQRMHGYKDKLQKDVEQESIGMGLFSYPVLMASDILTFKPDMIPVGEDQTQHVEITREIARSFNNRYGNIFKIPELYIRKVSARVKGIDGERKMSKSLGNDIPVFGNEEEIKKQIMKITTDKNRIHADDPGDPEKNVAFDYLNLLEFDANELTEMKEKYKVGKIKDVEIKEKLFDKFMSYFSDLRKRKTELESNLDYAHQVRQIGAAKANDIANETLEKVKNAVGFKTTPVQLEDKPMIKYDDFAKLDIRIGKVLEAERVEGSDKLLKLQISFGSENRQLLAGIGIRFKPEEIIGKQIPVIFNLQPRKMMGLESQGMIMATDNESGMPVLLIPEEEVLEGAKIR